MKAGLRQFEQQIAGESIQLVSQPGFEHWDAIDPAAALLAEYSRIETGRRVLVWPCGNGALAVWAARQASITCVAVDSNLIATRACAATASANATEITVSSRVPGPSIANDIILMRAPKGRQAGRMLLAQAQQMLSPGGQLYLAGANNAGIKSVLKDASELFGAYTLLGYRRGHRVACLAEPNAEAMPTWLTDGIRPGSYRKQAVAAGKHNLEVWSRPGVFSWQHLDVGTDLLIRHADLGEARRIVDVGCGCGIIGAWAARCRPQAEVLLTDVDALGVDCAIKTIAANNLSNAHAQHADGLEATSQECDLILSNPPFHAGHGIAYDMVSDLISQAPRHLRPGGRLVLVANRFLAYGKLMDEAFGGLSRIVAQTGKFHVLEATHRPRRPKRRSYPSRRR